MPLSEAFEQRIQEAVPDENQPIVVDCYDQACTASPTAAQKVDELGYRNVYDYEAGKMEGGGLAGRAGTRMRC